VGDSTIFPKNRIGNLLEVSIYKKPRREYHNHAVEIDGMQI